MTDETGETDDLAELNLPPGTIVGINGRQVRIGAEGHAMSDDDDLSYEDALVIVRSVKARRG